VTVTVTVMAPSDGDGPAARYRWAVTVTVTVTPGHRDRPPATVGLGRRHGDAGHRDGHGHRGTAWTQHTGCASVVTIRVNLKV
jgi:hypothetical protein